MIGRNVLQWKHFYDLVLRDYDWRFSFFFFSPYFFDGPTDICLPRQNIISKQDVSIQYIEDMARLVRPTGMDYNMHWDWN